MVQNGPSRKNQIFPNLMSEMEVLCPRKVGTKKFQNFYVVILGSHRQYSESNHQILKIILLYIHMFGHQMERKSSNLASELLVSLKQSSRLAPVKNSH